MSKRKPTARAKSPKVLNAPPAVVKPDKKLRQALVASYADGVRYGAEKMASTIIKRLRSTNDSDYHRMADEIERQLNKGPDDGTKH